MFVPSLDLYGTCHKGLAKMDKNRHFPIFLTLYLYYISFYSIWEYFFYYRIGIKIDFFAKSPNFQIILLFF
jgi:hypothetical protein